MQEQISLCMSTLNMPLLRLRHKQTGCVHQLATDVMIWCCNTYESHIFRSTVSMVLVPHFWQVAKVRQHAVSIQGNVEGLHSTGRSYDRTRSFADRLYQSSKNMIIRTDTSIIARGCQGQPTGWSGSERGSASTCTLSKSANIATSQGLSSH